MSEVSNFTNISLDELIKEDKKKLKEERKERYEAHHHNKFNQKNNRHHNRQHFRAQKAKWENQSKTKQIHSESLETLAKKELIKIAKSLTEHQKIDLSNCLPPKKINNRNSKNQREDSREKSRRKNHNERERDNDCQVNSKGYNLKIEGLPLDYSTSDIMRIVGKREISGINTFMKETEDKKSGKTVNSMEVLIIFRLKEDADSFIQAYSAKQFEGRSLTFQLKPRRY